MLHMATALINGQYEKLHHVMFSDFSVSFSDGTEITVRKDLQQIHAAEKEVSRLWKDYNSIQWEPEKTVEMAEQEKLLEQADQIRKEVLRTQKMTVEIQQNRKKLSKFVFCYPASTDRKTIEACLSAVSEVLGSTKAIVLDTNRLYVNRGNGNFTPKIPVLIDELQNEVNQLLLQPRHFVSRQQQDELHTLYMDIPSRQEIPKTVSVVDPVYELYLKIKRFSLLMQNKFGLPNKYMFFNPDHRISFWTSQSSAIPVFSLSAGESNLFVLLYELVFHCDEHTIVMIDEPENSMHVSWQMDFVDVMQELLNEQRFQALVTTHSPNIINDHWDVTIGLGEDEDGEDEPE